MLAFAYDSRTKGNVATEIVKYYLQLHFGIKKDYRNFDLLKRGNFYQSELSDGRHREREPRARPADWAGRRRVGAVWRAFDLQLDDLRRAARRLGLVMAYSNSVEAGTVPLDGGHDVHARADVDRASPSSSSSSRPPSTTTG